MSGDIMRKRWFKWAVAVVIIVALMVVSVVVWDAWGKPEVNKEAENKAQELFDLAQDAGMLQQVDDEAAFVEDMTQVYGDNGGYGVELAESALAKAYLVINLAETGEVTQRSIIANPKFLEFQLLVMKVYRPDAYRDKILPYIKGLKFEGELPAWLQKDLQSL
jgi:predicted negative regulator of RcsB-dependent stress response